MTRNSESATFPVGAANRRPQAVGGERYAVRCVDPDGKDIRIGSTTDPTGGSLMDMVLLDPLHHDPYVVDLHEE